LQQQVVPQQVHLEVHIHCDRDRQKLQELYGNRYEMGDLYYGDALFEMGECAHLIHRIRGVPSSEQTLPESREVSERLSRGRDVFDLNSFDNEANHSASRC
jgi:hypothetical protein